jgi:hypothetical protein
MKWDLSRKGGLILTRSPTRPKQGNPTTARAVQAHYDAIAQLFKKGEVIPFLSPRVVGHGVDSRPPLEDELAHRLTVAAGFADSVNPLTRIAQQLQIVAGRGVLYDHLREIYQPDPYLYHPALTHRFLARIPYPMLMLSTTYDTLLEEAFDEMNKKYVVVTHVLHSEINSDEGKVVVQYSDQKERIEKYLAQELVIDLSQWSVIYKVCGTFGLLDPDSDEEIDSIVVTEEDYIGLIRLLEHPDTTIPNYLARQFKKCMFLFLDYNINDWNWRAVLDLMERKGNFRRIQPYAVHASATEFERLYWESKRVRVLDTELCKFINGLADALGIDV